MNRVTVLLIIGFSSSLLFAQDPEGNYNPFVSNGLILPSPLSPHEAGGVGMATFVVGNSGNDTLKVFSDQYLILTITLSFGIPDGEDPLAAIGGTSKGLFSWSYNEGTFTATQKSNLPSSSSGTIDISFRVTKNSSSPGANGFNVNITPAPYQSRSNLQKDDAVSSYTYTSLGQTPSIPTGLVIDNISESGVSLSWNASTDDVGVTGYHIYRDGLITGTVSETSFSDNSVVDGNTYSYAVSAIDGEGNESPQSASLTVTLIDITAPSVPIGLRVTSVSANSVSLSWDASTDNVGVSGYSVYRNGMLHETTTGLSYFDQTLEEGEEYTYWISAYDAVGNQSEKSESITVIPTSVLDLESEHISIYPNPSKGRFLIETVGGSGSFILEIIGLTGGILKQEVLNLNGAPIPLYLSGLEAGIYHLHLFNSEGSYHEELIIL